MNKSLYTQSQLPPIQLTGNAGGGFLGNHNYLLTTFQQADENYVPNGALLTNRTWARAVLSDALCRELPVVREADVQQFVIPASAVPFRQLAACNACHATTDRMAGLIRGVRYNQLDSQQQDSPLPDLFGIFAMHLINPSLPADNSWSDQASTNYTKRTPSGRLYFRNYQGVLVDQVVNSIEEFGTALRQQNDYYGCFAKRYYNYFMGIDVLLGDPGSPNYPELNPTEIYHRAKVIELADRLKIHKSLRQLILEILALPEYRMSDNGASYQGTTP